MAAVSPDLQRMLAEHIPLKQGLRLYSTDYDTYTCHLAEHIPLKQGLRLHRSVLRKLVRSSQSIFH